MPRFYLDVSQVVIDKALSLCDTLGIHSLDQLFDQMVEELECNTYHRPTVKAALLSSRAIDKTAKLDNNSPGHIAQTGDKPA